MSTANMGSLVSLLMNDRSFKSPSPGKSIRSGCSCLHSCIGCSGPDAPPADPGAAAPVGTPPPPEAVGIVPPPLGPPVDCLVVTSLCTDVLTDVSVKFVEI